ncbi:hypothetical protein [Mesorhizobium sp. LjNodule214]|uniref:hypothetical protein n=1 Tax=Mesorhizobium sp. LjNodule214 TaxID=3342252 RepID=UPI003ECCEEAB
MPNTKQTCSALVRRVGYDPGRTKEAARSLTESGLLPSGAPGLSPELTPQHVATLMLGAALDVPLRAVADTVRSYRALRLEGVPQGAPAAISGTAGDELDVMAEIAATGSPEEISRWAKGTVSVVSTWPEVAFTSVGRTHRFSTGEPGRWQAYGHRKSVEINNSAFIDVITDLFSKD